MYTYTELAKPNNQIIQKREKMMQSTQLTTPSHPIHPRNDKTAYQTG